MKTPGKILITILTLCSLAAPVCLSQEAPGEEQKRANFIAAYNGMRAEKRLAAISKLTQCKAQLSIEMLYYVSVQDADPEVRSRAFSALVHCEDTYGYTAYLAANSFKEEKEIGVKVEKAVQLDSLHYKWSALNELVGFLGSLRWNYWYWNWYKQSGGYIGSGNPPESLVEKGDKKAEGSGAKDEGSASKTESGGIEDTWRNVEPLRWRNENELIAIVAGVINRMSGTQLESRPRIDQEIVKWWERKSELWAEYDRKLRTKTLEDSRQIKFKSLQNLRVDEVQPGKDTLRGIIGRSTTVNAKDSKSDSATHPSILDEE